MADLLLVRLGLDQAEFTKGLRSAVKAADDFKSSLVKSAAAAAAAYLSVDFFKGLVQGAIDAADHLNDLSKQTGIAVETLGGIGFAAQQAGGSLDGAASAIGKLNKSISSAAAGNKEAQEGFKALGVSVRDASGQVKNADKLLLEIADRFQATADGPEKAAIAIRLFGKAGAEMIPMLNEGAAALRTNIDYFQRYSGVTTEVAEAADRFNDTTEKIRLLNQALGTQLAASLLPTLQSLAEQYLHLKENGETTTRIVDALSTAFNALVIAGGTVGYVIGQLGDVIGGVSAAVVAAFQGDFKGAGAILDDMSAQSAIAAQRFDAFTKSVGKADAAVKGADFLRNEKAGYRMGDFAGPKARLGAIGGGRGAGGKDRQSEAERYLEALQRQVEKTQDLSRVEQVYLDIRAKRIDGLTPKLQAAILLAAMEFDLQKKAAEQEKERAAIAESLYQDTQRRAQAASSEAESLIESNTRYREETEALGLNAEALFALERARISSAIAIKEQLLAQKEAAFVCDEETEALQRQIVALRERLGLIGNREAQEIFVEGMKRAQEEAQHLNDTLRGSFEDAFVDFIGGTKSAGDAFKAFANSVISELIRIQAQKLALRMFGSGSGDAGWLGRLFSSGGGNGYSSTYVPPAGGFPLAKGMPYVPFDGFPATLHKGERVLTAAENRDWGGRSAPRVTVNNYAGADVSTEQDGAGDLVVMVRRIADERIARQSRPGGAIRQGLRQQPPKRG